jgi:hypothetical protein
MAICYSMNANHFLYEKGLIFLTALCCLALYSDHLQVGMGRTLIHNTEYHNQNCNDPASNSIMHHELNQSLSIRGIVNLSASEDHPSITLKPFRIMPSGILTPLSANSTFSIELIDEDGKVLAHYPTDIIVSKAKVEEWRDMGYISEAVPLNPCTTKVTINNNDEVLASQVVSPHPPEILSIKVTDEDRNPKLIFPRASNMTVEWQARDLDNDDLTYLVQYSNDGGLTWPSTITDDLNETSLELSANSLEGNTVSLSKFRVIATDGINTDIRDSDSFSVPFLNIGH